mmetsp:Transcript_11561/g.41242  ORF Transcript_11561/g.41242 Transcript_11561/m.41242 type:complete len:207 (-) Transcript_11561:88-708(-)
MLRAHRRPPRGPDHELAPEKVQNTDVRVHLSLGRNRRLELPDVHVLGDREPLRAHRRLLCRSHRRRVAVQEYLEEKVGVRADGAHVADRPRIRRLLLLLDLLRQEWSHQLVGGLGRRERVLLGAASVLAHRQGEGLAVHSLWQQAVHRVLHQEHDHHADRELVRLRGEALLHRRALGKAWRRRVFEPWPRSKFAHASLRNLCESRC